MGTGRRRARWQWVACILCVALGACQKQAPASLNPRPLPVRPTEVANRTPEPLAPGETPQPLNEPIPNTTVAAFASSEDGVQLTGRLFGFGRGPGIVLIHDAGSDMSVWFTFAQRLREAGHAVLAFDLRGHGRSGGTRDLRRAPSDIQAALEYMRAVGSRSSAVAGLGAGGTAAVVTVAGRDNIGSLAVLGSPPAVEGLDASESAKKTSARVLVVSGGSPDAARLADLIPESKVQRLESGPTPLGEAAVADALFAFLTRR